MNDQPIEAVLRNAERLDVVQVFKTLQGEGPFVGYPAVFVRLAGCNLQCAWCDTDYTTGRALHDVNSIYEQVIRLGKQWPMNTDYICVVTGGEPLRQPDGVVSLVSRLKSWGTRVQIETNGILPLPEDLLDAVLYNRDAVHIVVSPKGRVHPSFEKLPLENLSYKYVLDADNVGADGLPTTVLGWRGSKQVSRPPPMPNTQVFVQPADLSGVLQPRGAEEEQRRNLKACVQSAERWGFRLGIQLHKIAGVE